MTVTVQTTPVERRAAQPRDTALLRELFAETREDLFVLPTDSRELIVDMRFRAARRQQQLEYPTARRELLVVDGVVVGQLALAEEIATVHVVELSLRSYARGRGVGSSVLADIAIDADRTRRTLRTRLADNDVNVRRWIERFGFAPALRFSGQLEMVRPPVE